MSKLIQNHSKSANVLMKSKSTMCSGTINTLNYSVRSNSKSISTQSLSNNNNNNNNTIPTTRTSNKQSSSSSNITTVDDGGNNLRPVTTSSQLIKINDQLVDCTIPSANSDGVLIIAPEIVTTTITADNEEYIENTAGEDDADNIDYIPEVYKKQGTSTYSLCAGYLEQACVCSSSFDDLTINGGGGGRNGSSSGFNTAIGNKLSYTDRKNWITTERLQELRKRAQDAIKQHKIFTIRGCFYSIRKCLIERGWVEKLDIHRRSPTNGLCQVVFEDFSHYLPVRRPGESRRQHLLKCERNIISRFLEHMPIDFLWSARKEKTDWIDMARNPTLTINKFHKSPFTTKEGICTVLRDFHWYFDEGKSEIYYPRSYNVWCLDELSEFIENFRLTACISSLRYLVEAVHHHHHHRNHRSSSDDSMTTTTTTPTMTPHQKNKGDLTEICDQNGTIPISFIEFALKQCKTFIRSCLHYDIDEPPEHVWDHEWDVFLTQHQMLTQENGKILNAIVVNNNVGSSSNNNNSSGNSDNSLDNCDTNCTYDNYKYNNNNNNNNLNININNNHIIDKLICDAERILIDMAQHWSQYKLDGIFNIWIVKPSNKCRGRGIQLMNDLKKILNFVNPPMLNKGRFVLQKYIERPLIIHNCKFDIRQWFLVTSVQPLIIWMYKESYLRFSSQEFTLVNYHESVHLTNHAIQKRYRNGKRDERLPKENMWDCHTFQAYLRQIDKAHMWSERIYPGMQKALVGTMLASQDSMDRRCNTFELFGADFMISEDCHPWLIEINASPDLGASTSVTARLCPQCLEDVVKVVIDYRNDPKSSTGGFELIYRQIIPPPPAYLGLNLFLKGTQILPANGKKPNKARKSSSSHHHTTIAGDQLKSSKSIKDIHENNVLKNNINSSSTGVGGPYIMDLIDCLNIKNDLSSTNNNKNNINSNKSTNRKRTNKIKTVMMPFKKTTTMNNNNNNNNNNLVINHSQSSVNNRRQIKTSNNINNNKNASNNLNKSQKQDKKTKITTNGNNNNSSGYDSVRRHLSCGPRITITKTIPTKYNNNDDDNDEDDNDEYNQINPTTLITDYNHLNRNDNPPDLKCIGNKYCLDTTSTLLDNNNNLLTINQSSQQILSNSFNLCPSSSSSSALASLPPPPPPPQQTLSSSSMNDLITRLSIPKKATSKSAVYLTPRKSFQQTFNLNDKIKNNNNYNINNNNNNNNNKFQNKYLTINNSKEYRKYINNSINNFNHKFNSKLTSPNDNYCSHFFAVGLSLRAWRSKYNMMLKTQDSNQQTTKIIPSSSNYNYQQHQNQPKMYSLMVSSSSPAAASPSSNKNIGESNLTSTTDAVATIIIPQRNSMS